MGCVKRLKRIFLWTVALTSLVTASFFCIALILALVRGTPLLSSENLFLSAICAPIAWLFLAVFHFGKETISLPVSHPATFVGNARRVLQEMGYDVTRQAVDSLATRRGFHFLLFARGIRIQFAERQARIAGPKIWVDLLRRRLRVQNFLSGAQQSLDETQIRSALLKRVQIRMRIPRENLEAVTRHVLAHLTREAEVVCEISLLAQSETGIRESTIERHIRGWLHDQGIIAEVHKDLVMMSEPPSSLLLPESLRCKVPV